MAAGPTAAGATAQRSGRPWAGCSLAARRVAPAARLEQIPDALFRLVAPHLEQARGGDVPVLLADAAGLAPVGGAEHVVLAQLRQHLERRDVVVIVVRYALQAAGLADLA